MNETQFIDDRTLRDNAVGHYEVLEKVKELLLIPDIKAMTLKQVAEYYEVDPHTIEMICNRNADELESDGTCKMKVKDFLNSHYVRTEKQSYTTTFIYENGVSVCPVKIEISLEPNALHSSNQTLGLEYNI